jgi:hypothetical protein
MRSYWVLKQVRWQPIKNRPQEVFQFLDALASKVKPF